MKSQKDKILTDGKTNRKLINALIGAAEWVIIVLALCIVAYLTVLVFLYHFNAENSYPIRSDIFTQLLCVGAMVLVCWGVERLTNPYPKACKWISIIAFVAAIAFVGGVCFSYVSQTLLLPISDEKSCFDIALRFYESEFGAVVPQGSYLSLWPFQTGLIFIIEKLMRIFHHTDPLFFQQINSLYVLLIISSGYGMICMKTKRIEGRLLYLGLMMAYRPLIFRVTSVYGDIPGLAWTMCSCMCYMFFWQAKEKWKKYLGVLGFFGATIVACTYKSNSLIYIIAVVLVTLILQIQKRKIAFTVVVVIAALVSVFATDITQKYYEYYAGNVCGKGIPAIAWVAMGLQYNGEEAIPGGWNGFHSDTFMEVGYDYDATVEISKQSIEESLLTFANDFDFAVYFFHNKVLKQWANQTHSLYWFINSYYDVSRNQDDYWVQYLDTQKYQEWLGFEDMHESMVYAIFLLACCALVYGKIKKKEINFCHLLPVITFIGGFLFSLIWEGQARSVVIYPIILLPAAIIIVCDMFPGVKIKEEVVENTGKL